MTVFHRLIVKYVLLLSVGIGLAADYPTRSVRIVVPFPIASTA